jgi:hypothetical protein
MLTVTDGSGFDAVKRPATKQFGGNEKRQQ